MKKLILTLTLILCGYAVSQASILTKQSVELAVGSNPVSILENPNDGMIHIFCAGVDANDNNIYDEGEDEKPSWWQYNPTGSSVEPTMVMEFDNYFVSPFKPSIGTGLINITFKSDKMNNEFVGDTKFEVYSIANFSLLYDGVVSQSEVLTTNYYTGYAITLTRLNGKDLLSYTDITTNETNSVSVDGDIIDFTFVDLNKDGIDEVAILVDGERLQLFETNGNISKISEIEFDDNTGNNSTMGNLYTYKGNIYTTYKESLWFAEIEADIEGNIELKNFAIPSLTTLNNPTTYLPLSDKISVITNENNDLIIHSDFNYGTVEYHRTSTSTDRVSLIGSNLYVTGKGKVYIYDFKNSVIQEPSYITEDYFDYQPLDILPFEDNFYTINLGVDFNYDGTIDEVKGDQKPSIYSFTLRGNGTPFENPTREINFDFPLNYPLYTNISSDGDIPLPSGNMVHFYNVTDNEVYDTFDAEKYVASVNSIFTYLVMGLRDYETGKSYIRIRKDDQRDFSVEVGTNVADFIVYGKGNGFNVLSVSEGNFGQPDAKISLVESNIMTGKITTTEFDAGTTGSAVVANSDNSKAAIVMNGSHEIHIFDMNTNEIILTFSTGTTGYGGPRDAKFQGDKLYVSTYSNKILMFDSNTGTQLSSILIDGNSEGLALAGNYLLATNIQYSNYQPSNRVFAYDLDRISSVEGTTPTQQTIRVYPHPVSNDFHLVSDDLAGTNDIAIINNQGKIVATYIGSSNGAIALNADALGLVSGNYTAVINGTRAVRFVVIK